MVLTHTGHTPQQEHESTRAPDGGEGEKAKEGHKTVLVATSKKCLDLRVKEKRRNFCHQHVTSEPDKQHTQPWEVWNNSICPIWEAAFPSAIHHNCSAERVCGSPKREEGAQ